MTKVEEAMTKVEEEKQTAEDRTGKKYETLHPADTINTLRQAASFLRGNSTPEICHREKWADYLDLMADIEAAEERATDSRVAYRNVRNYLANDLKITEQTVSKVIERMVQASLDAETRRVIEGRRHMLDAVIKIAVQEIASKEVKAAVEAVLKSKISVTVG